MIKDIIDKAIKTEGIIEMEYSKDGTTKKFYQISNINYSSDYGDKCFCGSPIGSEIELTFRIDKVRDLQLLWDFVFEENVQLNKSGIYTLCFMADNYLDFGIYDYEAGEKILAHFHDDLWAIQAFHYIPYYTEANIKQWHLYDKSVKISDNNLYVFVFIMEEGINYDIEEDYDYLFGGPDFRLTEHSGIYYRLIQGSEFNNIRMSKGVNILAYSSFPRYYFDNLRVHNNIMWELFHKK